MLFFVKKKFPSSEIKMEVKTEGWCYDQTLTILNYETELNNEYSEPKTHCPAQSNKVEG